MWPFEAPIFGLVLLDIFAVSSTREKPDIWAWQRADGHRLQYSIEFRPDFSSSSDSPGVIASTLGLRIDRYGAAIAPVTRRTPSVETVRHECRPISPSADRSILPITHSVKVDTRKVLPLTFQGSAL